MGRHSACKSPHPFCGEIGPVQVIAHVIPQTDANEGTSLLAIYLCRARSRLADTGHETRDLVEYAGSLEYVDKTPSRKLVVGFVSDGTFVVRYGPILNPVERDYSTGAIDQQEVRELYFDPEPPHTKWKYWESEITKGQTSVPEFRCMQTGGEWNIVDIDRDRHLAQRVAWLQVADDPGHNFGIHSTPNAKYVVSDNGSEFSRVVQENLPSTFR